ncbi:BTAD domain-containing putative transcriptional regulator [Piscinibacter sp.]|uniref:AfsR/SARP family transcriptional regulator n=1 Tax=Piscinibacter sp. TaxID=1903157 RepID=UPI0039E29BED
MQALRIHLLGQGRIELDGQALTRLLAPKQQALLYLLAAEDRPWPRARLATLLWSEIDEAAARGNLRGALSRLRRWLPGVLAVDAHEVSLADPAALEVDLRALRQALDAALPQAQRVAAAAAWRGPLLDGFEIGGGAEGFEDWLAATRQRARADILALRHDLLARADAAGRADEAIEHARALLDVDDADENAHMALMHLLAARGRRSAAIAQYEACKAALLQRLGARPSAACYALYVGIHAEASAAAPAPAAAPADVADTTPLFGRSAELALIAQRLADPACRWLTIVGPGGVGKTRLARAAAAASAAQWRHGVLLLSGLDDAGGALRDAQTLQQQVLSRTGADRLAPGALLLVLDNLETVPAAERFEPLLRAQAPGVAVLATSRRRVGGGREWLLELDGLSLARGDAQQPASSPAALLFCAAARRLLPGFDGAAEGEAVERICALAGGLPLALEMAARGVYAAGTRAVAERLAAGAPLGDADRAAHDRHRSLDAVMEDSWTLLAAPARRAALRLAQLPAAFDAELAGAAGAPPEALASLRENGWLRCDEGHDGHGGAGRWTMHTLQQAWLRRRADAAPAAEVMRGVLSWLGERLPAALPTDAAAASPPLLAAAAQQLVADASPDALARWIDAAAALLQRAGRQSEAAALVATALQRVDLPRWRVAGWRMRRAELLDGDGAATAAQRERLQAFVALGLPDLADDGTRWRDVLRAALRLRRHLDWPPPGPAREAFGTQLVWASTLAANAFSFLPEPALALRFGALAAAAGQAAQAPASLRQLNAGWGAASLGRAALARRLARPVLQGRAPAQPHEPRLAALLGSGRCALRIALGAWDGVAAELDVLVVQWQHLRAGRQEMEARSLAAKLAFYEGRLPEAWERFAQMSELALQRPGESWRAWGPIGQCEAGLCLGTLDDTQLQALFERAAQLLFEMENVDAAYVLRRHGLAARLAWRRGDGAAAAQAVRAGAAAAARSRLFGFWAHEGLAGLAEVLLNLRGEAASPLADAAVALQHALDAHVRRFPPAASLHARFNGTLALLDGHAGRGRALLTRAVELAQRQGALVDLARARESLARAGLGLTAASPSA